MGGKAGRAGSGAGTGKRDATSGSGKVTRGATGPVAGAGPNIGGVARRDQADALSAPKVRSIVRGLTPAAAGLVVTVDGVHYSLQEVVRRAGVKIPVDRAVPLLHAQGFPTRRLRPGPSPRGTTKVRRSAVKDSAASSQAEENRAAREAP